MADRARFPSSRIPPFPINSTAQASSMPIPPPETRLGMNTSPFLSSIQKLRNILKERIRKMTGVPVKYLYLQHTAHTQGQLSLIQRPRSQSDCWIESEIATNWVCVLRLHVHCIMLTLDSLVQ
ncbi:unnamed protein product [Periconia digitata]|uniref:Uncharacterized protein n=1 Tax=Periconia digitata TaxID=1303443 RepID=A0A9W4UH02_9PLEO|nr:unnamed protein product [Periconia digitata]